MKLRIKGHSLRLRISPTEMTRLLEAGRIEETIVFSPNDVERLTYALEQHADVDRMTIAYDPHQIVVMVSTAEAGRWAAGEDVGLYGEIATSDGRLEVAVEKDFACPDKDDAENADTFPNPKQGAVC
jgi:hypothetical protein